MLFIKYSRKPVDEDFTSVMHMNLRMYEIPNMNKIDRKLFTPQSRMLRNYFERPCKRIHLNA